MRDIACRFEEAISIGRRLGDERPAIMIRASAPAALRDASGIGDSVIGFEDNGELMADLDQALADYAPRLSKNPSATDPLVFPGESRGPLFRRTGA